MLQLEFMNKWPRPFTKLREYIERCFDVHSTGGPCVTIEILHCSDPQHLTPLMEKFDLKQPPSEAPPGFQPYPFDIRRRVLSGETLIMAWLRGNVSQTKEPPRELAGYVKLRDARNGREHFQACEPQITLTDFRNKSYRPHINHPESDTCITFNFINSARKPLGIFYHKLSAPDHHNAKLQLEMIDNWIYQDKHGLKKVPGLPIGFNCTVCHWKHFRRLDVSAQAWRPNTVWDHEYILEHALDCPLHGSADAKTAKCRDQLDFKRHHEAFVFQQDVEAWIKSAEQYYEDNRLDLFLDHK